MTRRRRSFFVLLLVSVLIGASLAVLDRRETTLGLDLQGGVQLVYEAEPTAQQPTVTPEALQRAMDIMRERVDALGVSEPELLQSGGNQIEVDLPGVGNAERAAQQVGTTAQLSFYDWEANLLGQDCRADADENADQKRPITGFFQAVRQASHCEPQRDGDNSAADRPRFYAFDRDSKRALNKGQPSDTREAALEDLDVAEREHAEVVEVPEGILVVRDQKPRADAPDPDRFWVLQDDPALSGTDIRNPEQHFDEQAGNEPIVRFEFTDRGREAFQEITRAIAQRGRDNAFKGAPVPQHFAIVLDDELVSAPSIDYVEYPDGIDGGTGAAISGSFTIDSAQDLAEILKIGALPVRLELVSRSQVSATLGRQALDQGLIAGVAGFALVAIFLLVFYRVLGAVAVLALGIYALYLFALIKLIPVTLTLPGIAGLILTIGVAADANIVVFERVKEELRHGRSISAGIAAGYKKGFATIVDANVVTLLVAFILFILATAGVKGFAFVLGVGTMVSLFTAVLATQAILLTTRGSRLLQRPSALGVGKQHKPITFDFVGSSKWFFSMSGVILLVCALALGSKGLEFGIDLESGTRVTAALEKPATVEQVRDVVAPAGFGDAKIQTISNQELGPNVVQIAAEESGRTNEVTQALGDSFGIRGEPEVTEIGPTFGKTVAKSALVAVIASLSVIAIYIALRFEWKFAVPVLIALMHDVLITAGVYALVGREVTTSTVAALLTILGFSLYDTIIVFDRIRENVPRMPSMAFSQIVNRSMSEVIVRSLATSFCTVLPVVMLFLFGGDTLKDFAFALIIGTLSGAYSSVFIASPVLVQWKEREPVYRTRRARIREQLGHVPAYAVATAGVSIQPQDPAVRRPAGGRRARGSAAGGTGKRE